MKRTEFMHKVSTRMQGHHGAVIGTAIGFFFGGIFLLWGFWKTIFFAIVVVLGYTIGTFVDKPEKIQRWQALWGRWTRRL
jgi:uncharacterized membrane protein